MTILHAGIKDALDLDEGEVILVNKPLDWTSFDVVARVRSMFKIKKIGHAGTLDPKADGLLILCTGKMTKKIIDFQDREKEYIGIIEFGATTKSFDSETQVTEIKEIKEITSSKIETVFKSFLGHQKQIPPMYSAVKKNGRRLYKDARKGRDIPRESRDVFIKEFDLTFYRAPLAGFRVVCSKGTYIRSLANDCGELLGCGAYLKQLTRTRIGEFTVADALNMEDMHQIGHKLLQAEQ